MDQSHKELVLAEVRQEMEAANSLIKQYRLAIEQLENSLTKNRLIEEFLLQPRLSTLIAPPLLHGGGSDGTAAYGSGAAHNELSTAAIEEYAELALRANGPGRPMRAIDIINNAIDPDYDPEEDGRALENRVFSVLKRRPEKFVKVRRGMWTLREFLAAQPGLIIDEDVEDGQAG